MRSPLALDAPGATMGGVAMGATRLSTGVGKNLLRVPGLNHRVKKVGKNKNANDNVELALAA